MKTVAVIGSGSWGTALAVQLKRAGNNVILWSFKEEEAQAILLNGENKEFLPGVKIDKEINVTYKDEDVAWADMLIFATPSKFVRNMAKRFAPYVRKDEIIVNVAKGLEESTLMRLSEVIKEEIPQCKIGCLSGPSHAEEVGLGMATTLVAAGEDMAVAEGIQDTFITPMFRVYTNDDLIGVELGGALKNLVALAAGISHGLNYGDNTRAALITRGLSEMTRLGTTMGCLEQTFHGLAGIGDLIVTATSVHSRNFKCGTLIGQGYNVDDATKEVGMVVEGLNALPAAMQLAKRYDVEMPITAMVDAIVKGKVSPNEAVKALMNRDRKTELTKSVADINFENSIIKSKRGLGMKRVITYGTFDLLHYGHINLLKRAKALGDYLIVAVSTDEFTRLKKDKKCYFSYEQRKGLLESVRFVDLVIPEENWDQKIKDIKEYHIDTFVIGDDWKGKFDYLKDEGVEVIYLPRTPEISTTQIKEDLHHTEEK